MYNTTKFILLDSLLQEVTAREIEIANKEGVGGADKGGANKRGGGAIGEEGGRGIEEEEEKEEE